MIIAASALFLDEKVEESKAKFLNALVCAREHGDKVNTGVAAHLLANLFKGEDDEKQKEYRAEAENMRTRLDVAYGSVFLPSQLLLDRSKGITPRVAAMRTRAFSKGTGLHKGADFDEEQAVARPFQKNL